MKKNISKELIKNGIENYGIVKFIFQNGVKCKIGKVVFNFLPPLTNIGSLKEFNQRYTVNQKAEMVYNVIKDEETAKSNGIDEGRWSYCYINFMPYIKVDPMKILGGDFVKKKFDEIKNDPKLRNEILQALIMN